MGLGDWFEKILPIGGAIIGGIYGGPAGAAAGASIGGAIGGASAQSKAAKDAANAQAASADRAAELQYQAAKDATGLQREMFQKNIDLQEPFRQAGISGQNRLLDLLGLSGNTGAAGFGSAAKPFGMNEFTTDPGYQFRLSEGLKALDRQAAARGGLISGGALKAAGRYGQDYASGEYMNAFNRYQTERNALLNPLFSLSGRGQVVSSELGGAGQNMAGNVGNIGMRSASNIGDIGMMGANARASGYMGQANAWNSGLSNVANLAMKYYPMFANTNTNALSPSYPTVYPSGSIGYGTIDATQAGVGPW